ncbi:hypothetical protein FIBSPDRAFT_1041230 [Athelia psychrophila]|uniref:Uncharacterized protein n=1 Tax=Athelia psychrophila TaxID=1759441 RepID=A0A166P9W2_9AGAM|nr:hypothetical protein FIBSPDRAFT_1041230 [Fibularhizoctonia sp. CBS 109695]
MAEPHPKIDTSPAIQAPIDTLPNELLSDILMMSAVSPPVDPEQLPFALLVSSISRRWREVAILSQALWSELFFTADPRSESWCTNLFLPRSGTHPLDISINLLRRRESMHMPVVTIINKLLPHCDRWRKLCIRKVYGIETCAIQHMIQDISVPLLQHFELLCDRECIDEDGPHVPSLVDGAPALTSVKLRGLCLECVPPLANLTSFQYTSKASSVTQSQMESLVAASPALRVLHLRLIGFEASESGPINIPSLRELSLNFRSWDPFDTEPLHLFASMVAPALESLELVSLNATPGDLNALFQRFPNYPHPQTLKLSKFLLAGLASWDTLLGLFPTVTSLYLLAPTAEPTLSLLPALKSVTYHLNHTMWHESCVQWLCRHVQDCQGTPRAMKTVRIGHGMPGGIVYSANYRTLQDLVDLEELPDDADSLQNAWIEDDELESEEEDDESEEEDDESDEEDDEEDLGDLWEDQWEDENSDYELGSEDENEWGSDYVVEV